MTKRKKFPRKHRDQRKIMMFKTKVRNKRVHKVESYLTKVSKEDLEFLHLLMHLKLKDTEEAWVNII